jgi:hypothetical protein
VAWAVVVSLTQSSGRMELCCCLFISSHPSVLMCPSFLHPFFGLASLGHRPTHLLCSVWQEFDLKMQMQQDLEKSGGLNGFKFLAKLQALWKSLKHQDKQMFKESCTERILKWNIHCQPSESLSQKFEVKFCSNNFELMHHDCQPAAEVFIFFVYLYWNQICSLDSAHGS